jgi:HEXXH motif-containing protein
MPTAVNICPTSLLPPFESSVPSTLRLSGERTKLNSHARSRENYSTRRFLSASPDDDTTVLKTIPVAGGRLLICEGSSFELVRYSAERGLTLATDADANRATGLIQDALLTVIESCQFLWSAVSELVWCCHVVVAPDDDYDVSFSDPGIPFSVFVSVPSRNDRSSVLRVAESLIHETMHLQLTLLEGLTPLAETASVWAMYSPWKQQKRPTQGILHGLYVFCVLRWMWRQFSQTTVSKTDRDFAIRRVAEIDQEVSAVRALEGSPALTEAGKQFLHQLLAA